MAHRRKSKDKAVSLLVVTPVEKLQDEIATALKSFGSDPCIYVSLNKTAKSVEKALKKARINTKRLFFIDCTSEKSSDDIIHVAPTQLDKLAYAIGCFVKEISGKKFLLIDALSTLLIYNSENKVAGFAKAVMDCCSQNNVDVVALTPKTKGEELLNKVFNFFDEVKKR
jgi:archaellum biogenesis ATPase FlaH